MLCESTTDIEIIGEAGNRDPHDLRRRRTPLPRAETHVVNLMNKTASPTRVHLAVRHDLVD